MAKIMDTIKKVFLFYFLDKAWRKNNIFLWWKKCFQDRINKFYITPLSGSFGKMVANFQFFNYEQLPTVVHEVMLSLYILLYIKINQDWSRHQILHHIIFLLDKISRATEHTWAASYINLSESTMKLHNGKISKLIKEQIIYCQSSNGKIHSRLRARLCYHCKRKRSVISNFLPTVN